MTETETPVQPSGVQAIVTDSGQILLDFDHDDVPQIQLSVDGANRVGSYLNSVADRVKDNTI